MTNAEIIFLARITIDNQPNLDLTDWIQAIAILTKIDLYLQNKRPKSGSSVELWWNKTN